MAVLINWKICDNAQECFGIEACSTGALFWDEEKKSIGIDNSKCTNCGLCEEACDVDAIRVAKTDEEYKLIQDEYDKDPRTVSDLYIDRYGAAPITKAFQIGESKFQLEILESNRLTAVEFYTPDLIECLIKSVPVKELFAGQMVKYRKMEVQPDSELLKKYGITTLPCLALFENGELKGKVEGYYDIVKKKELIDKVTAITS